MITFWETQRLVGSENQLQAAGPELSAFIDAEQGWSALERIRDNQPDADHFALAARGFFFEEDEHAE